MATDLNSETAIDDSPAVWVGCWAAYNNGILHGEWVDLAGLGVDELREEIDRILKASPEPNAEEWGFFDNSGFYGMAISENPDLDGLIRLVELLGEHGAAYAAFAEFLREQVRRSGGDTAA